MSVPRRGKPERPLPPKPRPTRLCVFGTHPSIGWRWFNTTGWERVCIRHTGRPADYVPDTAATLRADP